jgi:hypothetical protein
MPARAPDALRGQHCWLRARRADSTGNQLPEREDERALDGGLPGETLNLIAGEVPTRLLALAREASFSHAQRRLLTFTARLMRPGRMPKARTTTVPPLPDNRPLTDSCTGLCWISSARGSPHTGLHVDFPRGADYLERRGLEMRLSLSPSAASSLIVMRDATASIHSPVALRTSVESRKSSASRMVRKPPVVVDLRFGLRN